MKDRAWVILDDKADLLEKAKRQARRQRSLHSPKTSGN
jgi:hypothetical protein